MGSSSSKNYRRAPRYMPPRRGATYENSTSYQQPPPVPTISRPSIQAPPTRLPPPEVYREPEPVYMDDDLSTTCPYGWVFSIMSCLLSLCILISIVIFIVWFVMTGRNVRIE